MNNETVKLRTGSACRVAKLDRDRYSEAIAGGFLSCVPSTTPGRARVFDQDDMLTLWHYARMIEEGVSREEAGRIACAITECAKAHPDAKAIAYVKAGNIWPSVRCDARPADEIPDYSEWGIDGKWAGLPIRSVTIYNIAFARDFIAKETAEELCVQGTEE